MYLKRIYARDGYHYILSESCHDEGCWKHRPLMDLGPDPGAHIEYPGGNSFHVKESFLEKVQGMAERFSEDALESLLMPFLDPHIRAVVKNDHTISLSFPRSAWEWLLGRSASFSKLVKNEYKVHKTNIL